MKHLSDFLKHVIDLLMAIGALAGFFFTTVVPALASLAALSWYVLRFYYFLKDKQNGNLGNDKLEP